MATRINGVFTIHKDGIDFPITVDDQKIKVTIGELEVEANLCSLSSSTSDEFDSYTELNYQIGDG